MLYMMQIIVTAMFYMLQILVLNNSVAVSGRTHGFSSCNTGCKNLRANSKFLLLLLVL